jgi:hypothetical protein
MENEKALETCFTKLFEILAVKYSDFNIKLLVKTPEQREALLALEKEYPQLGIWGFNKDNGKEIGVSVVSLLATVSDFLCGKRFSVIVDEVNPYDSVIQGAMLRLYESDDEVGK